jgi:hypothetical protein
VPSGGRAANERGGGALSAVGAVRSKSRPGAGASMGSDGLCGSTCGSLRQAAPATAAAATMIMVRIARIVSSPSALQSRRLPRERNNEALRPTRTPRARSAAPPRTNADRARAGIAQARPLHWAASTGTADEERRPKGE